MKTIIGNCLPGAMATAQDILVMISACLSRLAVEEPEPIMVTEDSLSPKNPIFFKTSPPFSSPCNANVSVEEQLRSKAPIHCVAPDIVAGGFGVGLSPRAINYNSDL